MSLRAKLEFGVYNNNHSVYIFLKELAVTETDIATHERGDGDGLRTSGFHVVLRELSLG